MAKLLILRPEPGASKTADRAIQFGLDPIVTPLFSVQSVSWSPPDPARFAACVMTSANAARLGGAALQHFIHLPLYAVAAETAAAASDVGFRNVLIGGGDVDSLGPLVPRGRVLHFAGREHRPLGADSETVTVYASIPVDPGPLPTAGVALVHSTRAMERFAALAPNRAGVAIVAISAAVGAAAGEGWRHMAIAERPDDMAMLALARPLCEGG